MKDLVRAGDAGTTLDPLASRARAVARVHKGVIAMYIGAGSLVVVVVGNVFGGSGVAHKTAVLAAGLVGWTGLLLVASATPHLARYGGRLGALSLASFAASGISGLVGVAEMFESFFLDSTILEPWGGWALAAAGAFAAMGAVLGKLARRKHRHLAEAGDT